MSREKRHIEGEESRRESSIEQDRRREEEREKCSTFFSTPPKCKQMQCKINIHQLGSRHNRIMEMHNQSLGTTAGSE